jgi:hypothetical protein
VPEKVDHVDVFLILITKIHKATYFTLSFNMHLSLHTKNPEYHFVDRSVINVDSNIDFRGSVWEMDGDNYVTPTNTHFSFRQKKPLRQQG